MENNDNKSISLTTVIVIILIVALIITGVVYFLFNNMQKDNVYIVNTQNRNTTTNIVIPKPKVSEKSNMLEE